MTNLPLTSLDLISDIVKKSQIDKFKSQNRKGVIPHVAGNVAEAACSVSGFVFDDIETDLEKVKLIE